jgi:hypothetical protein
LVLNAVFIVFWLVCFFAPKKLIVEILVKQAFKKFSGHRISIFTAIFDNI